MLCEQNPETTEHFLVSCKALDAVRKPILETFIGVCEQFLTPAGIQENLVQLILDPPDLLTMATDRADVDRHSKRLCHVLHLECYRRLSLIPGRHTKVIGKIGRST